MALNHRSKQMTSWQANSGRNLRTIAIKVLIQPFHFQLGVVNVQRVAANLQ